MRNTGLLLLIIGIFFFINSSNFASVLRGRYNLSFINPKSNSSTGSSTTGPAIGDPGEAINGRPGGESGGSD
jgi:hypothetical protein